MSKPLCEVFVLFLLDVVQVDEHRCVLFVFCLCFANSLKSLAFIKAY